MVYKRKTAMRARKPTYKKRRTMNISRPKVRAKMPLVHIKRTGYSFNWSFNIYTYDHYNIPPAANSSCMHMKGVHESDRCTLMRACDTRLTGLTWMSAMPIASTGVENM